MKVIKKIFNVLLIMIGIFFILLCADIILNKTVNTDFNSLGATDRQAIGEICDIVNLFDDKKGNSNVWDINYNLYGTGCVIVREYGPLRGRCYLVNNKINDKIFAQKLKMPDDYDNISVYRFALCTPRFLKLFKPSFYEGFVSINNEDVYASKYDVSTVKYNGTGSLEESFVKNTFAAALDSPDQPEIISGKSFSLDVENVALTGLQYRIIDDLLSSDKSDDINELIAEYVKVREYQYSLHPEYIECQEHIELTEGRVQHVFYNISTFTGRNITYFNKEKADSITFYSAYHYLCTGKYNSDVSEYFDHTGNIYVGAALCGILRDFDLCSNWDKKLDNATNSDFTCQYYMIKDYCEKKCSDNKLTLDDIKLAYNYDEIVNMATALVEGNESK
ncbi:MAG: hypothetical protein II589_06585 [Clostridia bacterium]|nr:hypothetical protein [Clostridia bacterium]